MKNIAYLAALQSVEGFGPVRIRKLLDFFEDPKYVWESEATQLKALGIPEKIIQNFSRAKTKINPEEFYEGVLEIGVKVVTLFDKEYPQRLKQIYDPPVVLYFKGKIPDLTRSIGIVGTRRISTYGKVVTEKLAAELIESGFVIVSGLARGVDTVAHTVAVENSGNTIAVLGGGLNSIFPAQNIGLAQKIVMTGGSIVSEYPPDYPSLAGNFPARNRIIAGLSQGVLVTEAAENSGSLITANLALEQGREVFAVPGQITSPGSGGTSVLIQAGAKLTASVEDILSELGLAKLQNTHMSLSVDRLSAKEKLILNCLENEQKHINEIVQELNGSSAEIAGVLIRLEISGYIKSMGFGNYLKAF